MGILPLIGSFLTGGRLVLSALLLLAESVLLLLLQIVTLQVGLLQLLHGLLDGGRGLGQASQHNGDLILAEAGLGKSLLHIVAQFGIHTIAIGLDDPHWNVAGAGHKAGRQLVVDLGDVI